MMDEITVEFGRSSEPNVARLRLNGWHVAHVQRYRTRVRGPWQVLVTLGGSNSSTVAELRERVGAVLDAVEGIQWPERWEEVAKR